MVLIIIHVFQLNKFYLLLKMLIRENILLIFITLSIFFQNVVDGIERPNIIIILADDLGWNDVSFHGSNQIQTPNIDALAYNGIILNSHYVPALCTPSRASLMTGKYPTSLGMQHLVILSPEPWGLPLNETLMPEYFNKNGYATHAVGKWHLGFFKKEYTPIYRGFDSHFGHWNGFQDYYDHTTMSDSLKGYDMRRNFEVDYSYQGMYTTDVFTKEAIKIIDNHNSQKGPLFLYLSHLAPHSGNPDNPFQAPEDEISKHECINDPGRKIYAAMVTKLDESVGQVVSALEKNKMLNNSIIIFMSDNGAATYGLHSNRGSNYPLRGLKESPWEGGVRGTAAIWSPFLNKTKRVSKQLMHMSDWLPTLLTAAGLNYSSTQLINKIDGIDMWNVLSNDLPSPRKEVFNNYDEIENYSSLMIDSWKYVEGTAQEGKADYWFEEPSRNNCSEYRVSNEDIFRLRRDSTIICDNPTFSSSLSITRNNHTDVKNKTKYVLTCDPLLKRFCLFNLNDDPCERLNLADVFPDVVKRIKNRLLELKKSVVKPLNKPEDPYSNPMFYNGTWVNWKDDIKPNEI
ncbi:arylsulfatase B precursor, putative [Pediculus humanus corporis]|uniref:Arylsulfatase B, putative n=1 Tax=Pediculus humanus subsp. corporis TaxID=121224 RepID=E0W496_PEDHC|nr:arylsulfatase B precursor, putative [Pediculus humanus corporis]EEB20452.1 arylsulfatase B precursor, putative [Pediculus humanus corporis]